MTTASATAAFTFRLERAPATSTTTTTVTRVVEAPTATTTPSRPQVGARLIAVAADARGRGGASERAGACLLLPSSSLLIRRTCARRRRAMSWRGVSMEALIVTKRLSVVQPLFSALSLLNANLRARGAQLNEQLRASSSRTHATGDHNEARITPRARVFKQQRVSQRQTRRATRRAAGSREHLAAAAINCSQLLALAQIGDCSHHAACASDGRVLKWRRRRSLRVCRFLHSPSRCPRFRRIVIGVGLANDGGFQSTFIATCPTSMTRLRTSRVHALARACRRTSRRGAAQ